MTQFRIPEIHCDGCIRALTGAIRGLDRSATLDADLETKLVRIRSAVSDEVVAEAIRDAGFDVEPA